MEWGRSARQMRWRLGSPRPFGELRLGPGADVRHSRNCSYGLRARSATAWASRATEEGLGPGDQLAGSVAEGSGVVSMTSFKMSTEPTPSTML